MTEKIDSRSKPADVLSYFLKTFSQKSINLWILTLTIILSIGVLIYYITVTDFKLFPHQDQMSFAFFNDDANNGNSVIYDEHILDSVILFNFHLKEGFMNPYVGLNITPKNKSFINASPSNQITLDIYAEGMENIGIYLNTYLKEDKSESKENLVSYFYSIKVLEGRNIYRINLNELKIPDWFLDQSDLKDKAYLKPNMNKIDFLNITTAYPAKIGDVGKIKIHSILFERNNSKLIFIVLAIALIIISLLLAIHTFSLKLSKESKTITIAYKPIEVNDSKEDPKTYLNFINSNFSNPDLNLELVSKETGIGQRIIAGEIQASFDCNFKTYINQIRINESKRLLKETDLNIGEIAYKVGFNNQSHYNRVFKSISNYSPSHYRS